MSEVDLKTVFGDPSWYLHSLAEGSAGTLGTARLVHLAPDDFVSRYWTLREPEPPRDRACVDIALERLVEHRRSHAGATAPGYYIFHTAFCGSTLLARAVAGLPQVLTLFEPRVLHDLRRRPLRPPPLQQRVVEVVSALLGRSPTPAHSVVVKVHADCNALLPALLGEMVEPRALFLYQDLGGFLAQVLKSPERRARMRQLVEDRALPTRRFVVRAPKPDAQMTEAEAAATSWLHNIHHFLELAARYADGALRSLDSAQLFAYPRETALAVARHIGRPAPDAVRWCRELAPVLERHAKDPARPFGEQDRLAERAQAYARHGAELEQGLRWARALAGAQGIPDPLPLPLPAVPETPRAPLLPPPGPVVENDP